MANGLRAVRAPSEPVTTRSAFARRPASRRPRWRARCPSWSGVITASSAKRRARWRRPRARSRRGSRASSGVRIQAAEDSRRSSASASVGRWSGPRRRPSSSSHGSSSVSSTTSGPKGPRLASPIRRRSADLPLPRRPKTRALGPASGPRCSRSKAPCTAHRSTRSSRGSRSASSCRKGASWRPQRRRQVSGNMRGRGGEGSAQRGPRPRAGDLQVYGVPLAASSDPEAQRSAGSSPTKASTSAAKSADARSPASTTSSWLRGPVAIPAAGFVMHETAATSIPEPRAARAS